MSSVISSSTKPLSYEQQAHRAWVKHFNQLIKPEEYRNEPLWEAVYNPNQDANLQDFYDTVDLRLANDSLSRGDIIRGIATLRSLWRLDNTSGTDEWKRNLSERIDDVIAINRKNISDYEKKLLQQAKQILDKGNYALGQEILDITSRILDFVYLGEQKYFSKIYFNAGLSKVEKLLEQGERDKALKILNEICRTTSPNIKRIKEIAEKHNLVRKKGKYHTAD